MALRRAHHAVSTTLRHARQSSDLALVVLAAVEDRLEVTDLARTALRGSRGAAPLDATIRLRRAASVSLLVLLSLLLRCALLFRLTLPTMAEAEAAALSSNGAEAAEQADAADRIFPPVVFWTLSSEAGAMVNELLLACLEGGAPK